MRAILLASTAVAVLPAAFMSDACDTVMVTSADWKEPVRINKSDYDADQAEGGEKRYTLNKTATKEQPAVASGEVQVPVAPGLTIPPAPSAPAFVNPVAPQTANLDTLFVTKIGNSKKFFVVRADGSKVEDMNDIDAKGYDTDVQAWTAVHNAKKQPHEQGVEALGTATGPLPQTAPEAGTIPAQPETPKS